eukprot:1109340-Amphidinium_carterae.1
MAELLRLMVTADQYDLYHSHSGEYAARWMMLLESAASRNPKVPSRWSRMKLSIFASWVCQWAGLGR